jgi:hypothetical protein
MKTNDELAGLLAERLYQLMREESHARGVVSIFLPFHPWENTSEVQRAALTNVVARVMREAREQKEEWTRAFVEDEVRRMRAAFGDRPPAAPGRFARVEEYTAAASRFQTVTTEGGFRERVDFITGTLIRLLALDAKVLETGRRLLQLRDSLQNAGDVYRVRNEGEILNATTAERFRLFAAELESIVYEGGLAQSSRAVEGSDEG